MTTAVFFDFGASASVHRVLECASVFTSLAPAVDIPSPGYAYESVRWRVELLRAEERDQWLEVEKLIPADEALNRITERFTPPREWFEEEDVL
jgi:hypothetical protein